MGKFTFEVSEEFIAQLNKLGSIDEYAPKMLDEAAPILESSIKKAITSVTSGQGTRELVRSIKKNKVNKTRWGGYYLQVRPTGTSKRSGGGYLRKGKGAGRKKVEGGTRDPIRNMEKAVYLEFGTSDQPPRPWAHKGINNAEDAVLHKMQEVFEREVKA